MDRNWTNWTHEQQWILSRSFSTDTLSMGWEIISRMLREASGDGLTSKNRTAEQEVSYSLSLFSRSCIRTVKTTVRASWYWSSAAYPAYTLSVSEGGRHPRQLPHSIQRRGAFEGVLQGQTRAIEKPFIWLWVKLGTWSQLEWYQRSLNPSNGVQAWWLSQRRWYVCVWTWPNWTKWVRWDLSFQLWASRSPYLQGQRSSLNCHQTLPVHWKSFYQRKMNYYTVCKCGCSLQERCPVRVNTANRG